MAIRELAELTWEDVRDLDRPRTVALLPVGAIEAHGPHLPLGTDGLIAGAMARAAAARLEARGLSALLLPPLDYSAAPFGAGFAGTISVAPGTIAALVADVAMEVERHGFAALAIANAHLDPAHLGALAEAVRLATARGASRIVCPDLSRREHAARLTDEFRSGACHAGQFETSVVLAERPDLVREATRAGLAPNPASLSQAIRDGRQTFEEAGGSRAYFGYPAQATAAEGRATIETLGMILEEAVQAELGSGART